MRHGTAAAAIVLLFLVATSAVMIPSLQRVLEPRFVAEQGLASLRTLFVTLGGALVGATAIAFSVVMFAVQINFARMPHGLFRKLSSDWRLLSAFTGTFMLAIAVATLSLIPDKSWLALAVSAAVWATALILVLFLYAYRRALILINPSQQLRFIVNDARKELRTWVRSARRAAPLLEREGPKDDSSHFASTHDMTRMAYFQANRHWTDGTKKAITHAISFARRYAEQGDHEVAGVALSAVVNLNSAYVQAKGKTFFTNHMLFDNPFATDGFINETLEHLRQNARIAISREDERQIEQTLQAMAALVHVYIAIDYSSEYADKTHANLAAGYLSTAVETVVPHNMPDVLMEGIRLMGQSAQLFLVNAKPNGIATLAEKIALISCTGIAKDNYRPVTLSGMEQLSQLTFNLIRTKTPDIRFAAGALKKNVSFVAKLFLAIPDTPLSSVHSVYLAPYYSLTKTQTLAGRLTELANALAQAEVGDEAAAIVIRNIAQWADGLYQSEKELLLAAIEQKSHFTFDVIHWIAHVTKILLVVSRAPACNRHTKNELQKHARGLILALSWIADHKDTVSFIETFQLTETLFEAALDAQSRDCDKVYKSVHDMLVSWAFRAGRHHIGWAILERSMYALATLSLSRDATDQPPLLKAAIAAALAKEEAPDGEIRDHAAREMRRTAATLYRQAHGFSRIEHAMAQIDHAKVRPLLEEIANLLSPETANEPVDVSYF
jgi:hypothetical protein